MDSGYIKFQAALLSRLVYRARQAARAIEPSVPAHAHAESRRRKSARTKTNIVALFPCYIGIISHRGAQKCPVFNHTHVLRVAIADLLRLAGPVETRRD